MRHVSTRSVALTLGVLCLAACRAIGAPPALENCQVPHEPLGSTSWRLATLHAQQPLPDAEVTLRFAADGTIGGSDGCNNYSGSYTAQSPMIRFQSDLAATMMACPEPIMSQARAYAEALKGAATFAVEAGRLILRDGAGGEVATFAAQSNAVAGTSWEVTAYNNGRQAVVSVIIGTQITAVFGNDGRITGTAGCNNYSASYDTDGETIAIGQAAATRKFCPDAEGVMTQEGRYLAALESAATLRIDGSMMHLRTVEGSLAVTLVRTVKRQGTP